MKRIDYSDPGDREFLERYLIARDPQGDASVRAAAEAVIADVKKYGDKKLIEYTARFDGVQLRPEEMKVSSMMIDEAYVEADPEMIRTIQKAVERIKLFHSKQLAGSYVYDCGKDSKLGQLIRPIERVGIYVPGGTAPLPSSVLMNAVPAKIAGVQNIVMATPPKKEGIDKYLLIAAKEAGVDEIYMMGGAQAIAAMAFGTETIPRVDKITGPGNAYVAAAKKIVFGVCDIDMIAGPSEICVIADETAEPEIVAADMLSQAEHDRDASTYLIALNKGLAERVSEVIYMQLEELDRKEIAAASIKNNCYIITADSVETAIGISDMIAPEHLELIFKDADTCVDMIKNAGAVFVGPYSPESLGDYMAGPDHVLPTSGTARFSSPLGVWDFLKRMSYINYSRDDLMADAEDIIRFARIEGLGAHADSIIKREKK